MYLRLLFGMLFLSTGAAIGCGSSGGKSPNGSGGNQDASVASGGGGGTGGLGAGGLTGTMDANNSGGSVQGGSGGAAGSGGRGSGGQVGSTGGSTGTNGGSSGNGGSGGSGDGGTVGTSAGGTTSSGGMTGGTAGLGGASGGATGGGGTVAANRVRTVQAFNDNWLFNYGDAAGADATAFADTGWRHLSVPHDWAIEGPNPPADPFSQNAPSTGRGAYLPSGIGWYRKHFTLAQSLSGNKVYIEFDGVMANSTVYVNGTQIGNQPCGYTSFRYDITSNVKFGTADNVIAVKTDTSLQPSSRFYAGAGIYRHVRLLATNPVHIDQWATYVSTPAPTTTAATVKVTTTVVNSGSASASVSVQGIVSDPSGKALAPVSAAAQTIAAGASANFAFDVPVSNPQLWDLKTPNMYQLVTNVQVGGATVDDDVTPFGIREIKYNAGLTVNGKSVKFQGAALHQDHHGLGMAAPQRAMQRRLAHLKSIGINAIRTAHDPPSPDFLDLTDRMGLLVMDEFFDSWVAHKYTDTGDFATYFSKAASAPTGQPAVPGTATGATWYQVVVTSIVSRDRNHPSIALYSTGNEIRDDITTRTPILTKMIAIAKALDPNRAVTQALFQPAPDDTTGATVTLLDVFGANYRTSDVISAMASSPTKSGLLTEMGTETSTWAIIQANPGLTGLFMWLGADYLGEAPNEWPGTQGYGPATARGLMDAMGTMRQIGYDWAKIWGVTATPPATGTTASKVVLTADHTTLLTDLNDISFIKATIADSAGNVVTSSNDPVTFAITGPGTIVAVDSGNRIQETFRGNTRNAFLGLSFALVQATGPGTITVTAKSGSLTSGSATVTATDGTFSPCSGSCD
jgi:beta-galactosidase